MLRMHKYFGLLLGLVACAEGTPPSVGSDPRAVQGDPNAGHPTGDGDSSQTGQDPVPGGNAGNGNPGHNDGLSDNNCDGTRTFAQPISPDVLIVQDRSTSMIGANTTFVNRWDPSAMAINKAVEELQDKIRFGLLTFPTAGGNGCGAGELDVPFMLESAPAIRGALTAKAPTLVPIGNTPTGPALAEALKVFQQRFSDGGVLGTAYVLLVTDGDPTCGTLPSTPDDVSIKAANDAVDALFKNDIKTFVIGYDIIDANSANVMNGLAQRGGTNKFIPVEDSQSLLEQLKTIANAITPCDYHAGSNADPDDVTVVIDGKEVSLSEVDGWSIDGKIVRLNGEACAQIQDGQVHDVEVIVPCPMIF